MKFPPDVQFHPDLHLFLWKPRGVLDEAGVNQILDFIADLEAQSEANELRFTDTTAITAIDLNFRYIFHVALYRRLTRMERTPLKSAFFVEGETFAHYFKLHAVLTDHSALHARIFEEREAAAKWLDVPVQMLTIP